MENSKIEWTTHTFNPWIGCSKCSPGCEHCYAETAEDKRWHRVMWGPKGTRMRTSAATWRNPLRWNEAASFASDPVRVFCASLADIFENYRGDGSALDRPKSLDPWRHELFDLIDQTPKLEWLLLSKRPEQAQAFLKTRRAENIWMGVSVESQQWADRRIPILAQIPAKIRFLSCEPLIGPLDLRPYLSEIDWVIVGGESGFGFRPVDPAWVRDIRDQCAKAGVPFFFKQWGGRYPKSTGRTLDGRIWNEIPTLVMP